MIQFSVLDPFPHFPLDIHDAIERVPSISILLMLEFIDFIWAVNSNRQ